MRRTSAAVTPGGAAGIAAGAATAVAVGVDGPETIAAAAAAVSAGMGAVVTADTTGGPRGVGAGGGGGGGLAGAAACTFVVESMPTAVFSSSSAPVAVGWESQKSAPTPSDGSFAGACTPSIVVFGSEG
jgi:hypothetical protein